MWPKEGKWTKDRFANLDFFSTFDNISHMMDLQVLSNSAWRLFTWPHSGPFSFLEYPRLSRILFGKIIMIKRKSYEKHWKTTYSCKPTYSTRPILLFSLIINAYAIICSDSRTKISKMGIGSQVFLYTRPTSYRSSWSMDEELVISERHRGCKLSKLPLLWPSQNVTSHYKSATVTLACRRMSDTGDTALLRPGHCLEASHCESGVKREKRRNGRKWRRN